jgi:hypothetical protein
MNRIKTIIEALCYLLLKLGKADKIHLVKLMYLADKYHLMNYGRTITGDYYIAIGHGPAGSRTMNVLDYDPYVLGNLEKKACKLFKRGEGHSYLPGRDCSPENLEMLSVTDIESLNFSIEKFGNQDQWDVVRYTHSLPEWKRYEKLFQKGLTKREDIKLTDVLLSPQDKYFNISPEHLQRSCEIAMGSFD